MKSRWFFYTEKIKRSTFCNRKLRSKPIKVAVDEKGNKLVVLTIKNDSYWKNLKLRANVTTIARDKEHDTRTVAFPYVKGQKVYNAFVSIEVPKIGYKGNYDIRIINDEPNKEFEPIPIPKKKTKS